LQTRAVEIALAAWDIMTNTVARSNVQLVMNIPYQMCQFATYEAIKLALSREETAVEYGGAFTPIINFAAGGLAGGTAAAFTTPLDMVKTRLQTQGASGQRYGGALDAVRTIQAREGSAAFLKGMGPRVLFHVPSMAICWSTYESMKYLLT
jgi:solute carrier family 25 iron transporter 28/37